MDVQIYPLTVVTCQIGETAVEDHNQIGRDYVRTKMEKRICAAGSGQVMMTTGRRLTYETHTSSVGSYQSQTTCLSDQSTGPIIVISKVNCLE